MLLKASTKISAKCTLFLRTSFLAIFSSLVVYQIPIFAKKKLEKTKNLNLIKYYYSLS